jgi:Icc-related predicted phosphoesterase
MGGRNNGPAGGDTMRKVVVVGDTHGQIHHCRVVARKATSCGAAVVFVVGDFGFWEHAAAGVKFCDDIDELARTYNQVWYFLDGNHDKTSLILSRYGNDLDEDGFIIVRPGLRYAPRGHRWTWEGVSFIAIGGAYSVDKAYRLAQEEHDRQNIVEKNEYRAAAGKPPKNPDTSGTLWFPEEEMTDNDLDTILLADSSPVRVMLTHDKPRGSNPRWNRKDIPECWPNQDRIQRAMTMLRPDLLIHGHLHHRYSQPILSGNDHYTHVIGLSSDPDAFAASTFRQRYDAADSWVLLTLTATDAGPLIRCE